MVNHSLFRCFFLILIGFAVLNFSPSVIAATEDQIEKDLAEELNITPDAPSDMASPTSPAAAPEPELMLPDSEEPKPAISDSLTPPANYELPSPEFKNEAQANAAGYVIDERDYSPEPEVRYERVQDYSLPYKQRRGKHGLLFEVGMENIEPTEYYSLLSDTDVNINDLIGGSSVSLINVELGYKYNFQAGSLYLMGSYAMGSASGTMDASSTKLEISRLNLSVGYAADMIFNEPWVVPYGQVGVHQFDVTEKIGDASTSATTQPSLNFRAGLLFQLNWIEQGIDASTHSEGLRSSGLENTFLDVYATWYEPSESASTYDPNDASTHDADPDMRSEATLGVALKMEF